MATSAGGPQTSDSLRWKWPIYLLGVYPIVDYLLHLNPWGILGQLWPKLLLVYLVFLAIRLYREGHRVHRTLTATVLSVYLLLGVVYIAMDPTQLTIALAGFEIDFMYIVIALLLPFVLTKQDFVPMIKWIVFSGFLLALHGLYEYAIKAPVPAWWFDTGIRTGTRVYSVFWSSNAFADYLACVIPLALSLSLYETAKGAKWFYRLAALSSAASLVFTGDRGAWIALLIGMLIWSYLVDKRLIPAILVTVVLAFLLIHSVRVRLEEFVSPVYWSKTFANGRIAEYRHAITHMMSNPLFGSGLGTYGGAVAARYLHVKYVDGFYAFLLAETGIVGFLAYLVSVAFYFRDTVSVLRRTDDKRMKYILFGVIVSLVTLSLHAFVENIYQVPAIVMTFWLTGTLAIIYGAEEKVTAPAESPLRHPGHPVSSRTL